MLNIYNFFHSFWDMTVMMHGYILFGLLIAGVMREFISDDYIRRNLGGTGFIPSLKAAVLGLPLPICSCGVIPLAVSLRKSGAGKGAVTSFFISTPMTGADSVIATYGVFGWGVTLLRVAASSMAAVFAGYFTDLFLSDKEGYADSTPCCSSGACSLEQPVGKGFTGRLKSIFNYAFGELLSDLAFPLLTGFICAAVITLLITPEMIGSGGTVSGYLIAFAAGIPLYVCSISAIPVSLSLLLAGFSPGAAFVFLVAAPATNVVTLNVVRDLLGKLGLVIYTLSIIFFALLFALFLDGFLADSGFIVNDFKNEEEHFGVFSMLTSSVFLLTITAISIRQKVFR